MSTQGAFYNFDAGRATLLVQHGFIKDGKRENYTYNEEKKIFEAIDGYKFSDGDADIETREILQGEYGPTGFPTPHKFFRLSYEAYDLSLEEPYYWVLEDLQQKYSIIDKIEDSFAASENSAFFGLTQQRLGMQQDKISQFLATTGKMIKELFQMVRELRIIDERMTYYEGVEEELKQDNAYLRKRGDEITLKGLFVDLVQGGGKSAASVYGMARELEFITLPDLFFDAPPFKNKKEMEDHVWKLEKDFNKNVLRVLLRHLNQYRIWRERTAQEHEQRKNFQLTYLKQHFEIIQMYIAWVKPYLRNVRNLSLKGKSMKSPDLVSAFEGSMLDIELLARKVTGTVQVGDKKVEISGCCLTTINYRTRPELKVVQDGYNRGPVHIGRFEMNLRVYTWTDEEVEAYKQLKKKEDMELMADISSSVSEAMKGLGDELDKYLKQATEKIGETKEKKESEKSSSVKKPFAERFFGDFYTPKKKKTKQQSNRKMKAAGEEVKGEKKEALGFAGFMTWLTFKNFKKAHRMIQW